MSVSGMLDEQLKSIKDTRSDLESQALLIIAEIQEWIIDLNREEQLFEKGIDSKGSLLKPYTSYTIALKKQKGEVYNRTTLLDTGDFYEGFYLTAKNGFIEVSSSDDKTGKLKSKYGKNIFGFTVDHELIINERILEELLKWILTKL